MKEKKSLEPSVLFESDSKRSSQTYHEWYENGVVVFEYSYIPHFMWPMAGTLGSKRVSNEHLTDPRGGTRDRIQRDWAFVAFKTILYSKIPLPPVLRMWIRRKSLTVWKRLVFSIKYEVCWSLLSAMRHFNCAVEILWFRRKQSDPPPPRVWNLWVLVWFQFSVSSLVLLPIVLSLYIVSSLFLSCSISVSSQFSWLFPSTLTCIALV